MTEQDNRLSAAQERLVNEAVAAPDPLTRDQKVRAIAQTAVSIVDLARQLSTSDARERRIVAAELLGRVDPDDRREASHAAKVLSKWIQHDPDVAPSAAVALARLPGDPPIAKLNLLRNDPRRGVRVAAAMSLRTSPSPIAIDALVGLAQDPDPEVRGWATFALAEAPHEDEVARSRITDALVERLADDHPEVRGDAILALAERRDARAIPAIEKELSGHYHGLWAVEAAEVFPSARFLPLLKSQMERLSPSSLQHAEGGFRAALAACEQAAD